MQDKLIRTVKLTESVHQKLMDVKKSTNSKSLNSVIGQLLEWKK